MYHSELELTREWSDEEKNNLLNFIEKFPNLKGVSFHIVTRYPFYEMVNGVAFGKGNPMNETTLLLNAEVNANWFKEKMPKLILMVENNNDLGSDAYEIVTDANFLNKIVLSNDIYFLYDHAHALISSYNKKIKFEEYFKSLPISKTKQVHLSEPSFKNNIAIDSHLAPSTSQIDFCKINFQYSDVYLTIEFYNSLYELNLSLRTLKDSIMKW